MYIESKNKKLKCNQIDIKVIFQRNAKNKVAVLLLSTCKAILSLIEPSVPFALLGHKLVCV